MKNAVQNYRFIGSNYCWESKHRHIYALQQTTVPNYLKVGTLIESVATRLEEWSRYFPELKKEYAERQRLMKMYILEILQSINFWRKIYKSIA